MDKYTLKLIDEGNDLKYVAERTYTCYSTIRKISSLNKFIKECKFLSQEQTDKLYEIGLNALVLRKIRNNEKLLINVINSIDTNITRAALTKIISDLDEQAHPAHINISGTIICSVCGKEITETQGVAIFTDDANEKYTHVISDGYDCDYIYMMEVCNPIYRSNINEID